MMITVAIVAILTAIAYPAYRNYVLRGQIVYATNNLSQVSANMERWFQDNRTYVGGPCTPPAVNYGPNSTTYFAVSCLTTPTATTYTISAVGSGSVAGFIYTLDYQGNQTTTVSAPAPSAWRTPSAGCAGTSSWETSAGTC